MRLTFRFKNLVLLVLFFVLKETPYLNIEGDHKGEVPFEEGADVSLKCRLEGNFRGS